MGMPIRFALVVGCLALLVVAAPSRAQQDYPNRPVRFVIPDSPGGVNDRSARIVAPALSKALGQPVVVDNRPGAAGLIAWEYVAKNALADGYTIALCNSGILTLPLFIKDLRFDTLKDLRQVMIFSELGIPLIASMASPFNTFNQMVAYAKANPGKLNFGVPGFQSQSTLLIEAIKLKFGLDIVVVVFKGPADVPPAIYTNEVQLSLFSESTSTMGVKSGKLKVLASASGARMQSFPDVPTLAELGMTDVGAGTLVSIAVARATAQPVFERIVKATQVMMDSADVRDLLNKTQIYPVVTLTEEADRKVAAMSQFYANLAMAIGIKPQ